MFSNTTRSLGWSGALLSSAALFSVGLTPGAVRADDAPPTASPPPALKGKVSTHTEVVVGSPAIPAPPDAVSPEDAPAPTTTPGPVAADRPSAPAAGETSLADRKFLSGFRLGYLYVNEAEKKLDWLDGQSVAERVKMRSPHQFLVGYEAFYRMVGHSWLNVLLVGNVLVAGLEQNRFYPSANALIGFEFNNNFQLGVGINATPFRDSVAHTIFAAGWTPQAGTFYVPIHAFFIPDVDGVHRMGVTTGVTW